jgi:hypothetical protein
MNRLEAKKQGTKSVFSGVYTVGILRYKPEGRGFDSRWCHWNFSLT